MTEQIGHAIRFATMIPTQVEHQRLGSRDQGHGRVVGGTDDFRMAEAPQVEVADVAWKQLHAADAITLAGRSDAHLRDHLRDFLGGRFLVIRSLSPFCSGGDKSGANLTARCLSFPMDLKSLDKALANTTSVLSS